MGSVGNVTAKCVRRTTAGILCAVLAMGVAACGGDEQNEDAAAGGKSKGTFKIGLLNPTTGVFAQVGKDVNDGFKHYVESHGGRLAGYDIELVEEDDAGDPTTALTKLRRMVSQDQVDMVVGVAVSSVAYAISDFVDSSKVPTLLTITGADGLTQNDRSPYIYRISYTNSQPMMALGDYACRELGHETASILSLDFAFGWEVAGGFARVYEDAGCDVIQEQYVPVTADDYAPYVQQVKGDAQMVMANAGGSQAPQFWQAYRDFGVDAPVVGHGNLTDEVLLPAEKDNSLGAMTIMYWSRALDTPENQTFVETYEAKVGRVASQGGEAGYTGAQVVEAALKGAGERDVHEAEVLTEALQKVDIVAARGPLKFDAYHQAVMNFYIRETKKVNGKAANVVVETLPDLSQFGTYDPEEYLKLPNYESLKGTWER